MKKYIILMTGPYDYYLGKKYIYESEQYYAVGDACDAKRYSTQARALIAFKSMKHCDAGGNKAREIEEIEE
jgi:hypothetical protein